MRWSEVPSWVWFIKPQFDRLNYTLPQHLRKNLNLPIDEFSWYSSKSRQKMYISVVLATCFLLCDSNASIVTSRYHKSSHISIDAINEGSPITSTAFSIVDCISRNIGRPVICYSNPQCVATSAEPFSVFGTSNTAWTCMVEGKLFWDFSRTIASKINVTPKDVRLSEKLQLINCNTL